MAYTINSLYAFLIFLFGVTLYFLLNPQIKPQAYTPQTLYDTLISEINEQKVSHFYYNASTINISDSTLIKQRQTELDEKYNISSFVLMINEMSFEEKNQDISYFCSSFLKLVKNDTSHFDIKEIDNILIILLSTKERAVRIHSGAKLKKVLTNSISKEIISNQTKLLKSNQLQESIENMLDSIIYTIETANQDETFNKYNLLFLGILLIMIIAFIIKEKYFKSIDQEKIDKEKKQLMKLKDFLNRLKTRTDIINETCVICLEEMTKNQIDKKSVKTLPCRHSFHNECIETWMTTKKECPLCKAKYDTNTIEYHDKPTEVNYSSLVYSIHQRNNNVIENVSFTDFINNNIEEILQNYYYDMSFTSSIGDNMIMDNLGGGASLNY